MAVLIQLVAYVAVAQVGACSILTAVLTAPMISQALIHIITSTAVSIESVASSAVALIAPRVIGAVLLTARGTLHTFVKV